MSVEKRKRPHNIHERRRQWIDAELEDGEQVRWVGVAVLKRLVFRHWIAGIGAVTMLVIGFAFFHSGYRFVEEDPELFGYGLSRYFGVLYLIIGAGFATRIWSKMAPRRRPITVITDRRLLLFEGFFRMDAREVQPHVLQRVQVATWPDGTGAITVNAMGLRGAHVRVTFPALPEVHRAARHIGELMAEFGLPVQWEYVNEPSIRRRSQSPDG